MQLIFLFFLYWAVFNPLTGAVSVEQNTSGANRIALQIQGGSESFPDASQLQLARSIGITLLEVDHPSRFSDSRAAGFYLLLNSPLWYHTPHQLEDTGRIIDEIYQHYHSASSWNGNTIAAINLLNYPDDRSSRFHRNLTEISDSLSTLIGKPLYYRSAHSAIPVLPDSLSFTVSTVFASDIPGQLYSPVIDFRPSNSASESMAALQDVLNELLEFDDSIIIFPAGWFFERIEKQPDLALLFSVHIRGNEVTFPLPVDDMRFPDPNPGVILLFLILAIFVIHYRYQPTYPFFVVRYFFNHPFFVTDIMENRLRNSTPGLVMLFKHAALNGLFFFCLGSYFISESGWNWLTTFYPAIFWNTFPGLTLIILGIITAILAHFISLAWIYLLNKSLKSPVQVIHLYAWPLSLNLIFAAFLVMLVQVNASLFWVLIVAAFFVIVWFTAFNVAAIDGARFLQKRQALNLFLTVGIHFLLIVSVILFILFTPEIYEPLHWLVMIP